MINAVVFFTFWRLVLLARDDFPPPLGFIWIVVAVAVCAVVVYWRVPTYIKWSRTRRPGRYWRVVLDGIVAGLLIALPFVIGGSGEPSVTMQPLDYVIWFAVLAVMGIFNSVTIYGINALVATKIVVPPNDEP